ERARLHAQHRLDRLVMDARAALRTERARLHAPAVADHGEALELAREESERSALHCEAHAERAARLALTLRAVTPRETRRRALDAIPDDPALTSAVHGVHAPCL